ncbi:MAG: ABC transporter transmembrane domain-containing protein [Candidatus Binatia bacterium]|nr:ABC transporter transmembrane domain-containing protein [Candidatus Binatia bacterium]
MSKPHRPPPASSESYWRLLRYLRPYVWPRFTVAILCMFVFSATAGYLPFLIRDVFDDIFSDQKWAELTWLPAMAIGLFAVRGVATFGYTYLIEWVGQRIIEDLRNDINLRVQRLPISFFNRTPAGTLVSRATSDVTRVNSALTQTTISMLRDSTTLIVVVGAAFALDWVLAIIAFVGFPLAVGPVMKLGQRLRGYAARGQESLDVLASLLQETAQGNRVVKAFGMEEYEKERFGAEADRLFSHAMKATQSRALIQPIMEMLGAVGMGAVIYYGGYSVLSGTRTQGDFLGFMTALVLVYDPFKGLAKATAEVQRGMASAERVFAILDEPVEIEEVAGAPALAPLAEEIRLEGVRFRYPPRVGGTEAAAEIEGRPERPHGAYAIDGIDLVLPRGEALALVGPSGGGKSTLADLIPRFQDPTEGRVAIDGVDLRDVEIASLRSQIGIVTQMTFLFNDTVRANIAYGLTDPDESAVEAAARAAHAHEFICELPDGYDTVVGELGNTLSGGQRQRLAIARALLKNAPILILDEATSALDSESERLVQDAIDHLMAGRTTLVIAHRLATIRRCDRIAVLSAGRIAELGTHEELHALGGIYRRLHDQQALLQPAPAA